MANFRKLATLIEPKFQQLAIAELEKLGSNRYPSQQFALGDLYRRTGQVAQAKAFLRASTSLNSRSETVNLSLIFGSN